MTVSQIQKIERMKLMKKKMKKIVSILCMMSLLFSMLTVKVNASNDDIKVLVDGTELTFDVPPQIIDDYTMVPMRGIFEALGYDVVWDEENKQIVIKLLKEFKKEGCTIIMVTHDIQLAEECDRVIDLNGFS